MTATALADYREQLKQELANLKNRVAAPKGDAIRLKGKVFTFPDGRTTREPINVVVLDWTTERLYYDKPFNPQSPTPPVCSAVGNDISTLAPGKNVTNQQHETCAGCPRNEWGSAPTGRGKACTEKRRLVVVPPDATVDTTPMRISVSPTGLKAFDNYILGLEADESLPIQFSTYVGFNPDVDYPQLKFRVGPELDDQTLGTMMRLRQLAQPMLARDPSDE
jgi:hypothetical protein